MIEEVRKFITRGNLVDLAVAFALGVAFASVVNAFTDVVLGAISYVFGGDVSFDKLAVRRDGAVVIPYGAFLTAVVNFGIIGFVLFLVVKVYNRFRDREDSGPTEVQLLTEIRDALRSDSA